MKLRFYFKEMIRSGALDRHTLSRLARSKSRRALLQYLKHNISDYEAKQRQEIARLKKEWEITDTQLITDLVTTAAKRGDREVLEAVKIIIDTPAKRRAASEAYKKATK